MQGHICLERLADEDVILLAKYGDDEAIAYLWTKTIPQVNKICGLFSRKYAWIDHDDLSQEVMLKIPAFFSRYRPESGTLVNKYLYFCIYRCAQDALRRNDPLGMKFPQRKPHPQYIPLSDLWGDGEIDRTTRCLTDASISKGAENIDRGYHHSG